jgi:hypothetical protein
MAAFKECVFRPHLRPSIPENPKSLFQTLSIGSYANKKQINLQGTCIIAMTSFQTL